jgi:transcriptional regulator with PAS, ATPase and Fis domain
MDRLMRHDSPANLRELEHAIERAMVVSMEGRSIEADDLLPAGNGGDRTGAETRPEAEDAGTM